MQTEINWGAMPNDLCKTDAISEAHTLSHKVEHPVGYPGGEDQRDMDDEELNDSPFCECGNEPIEEEELTGHCFACGKELP